MRSCDRFLRALVLILALLASFALNAAHTAAHAEPGSHASAGYDEGEGHVEGGCDLCDLCEQVEGEADAETEALPPQRLTHSLPALHGVSAHRLLRSHSSRAPPCA